MSIAESALRRALSKIINDKYKNEDITLKELTSGGANYTSALYSVTVTSGHEKLKLFAKVASASIEIREMIMMRTMFETEHFVYSHLAEAYERIQQKHKLAPEHKFTFPKFYGEDDTDGEEVIILEDLVYKGYKPYSRFKSINWDHLTSCIKVLAKFHALSFAFAKEEPDNFARAVEKVKIQKRDNREHPILQETWKKMLHAGVEVARQEHKDKIIKLLDPNMSPEEVYKFRMPLGTPVLCHGDFRISNILLKNQVPVIF